MAERIVFEGKGELEVETFEPPAIGQGQVAVRSLYSLISTGTETIALNRLFEAGSHWDQWVEYPFYPGYATIGEVTEVGPGVDGLKAGQRVAMRTGHASHHVVEAGGCFTIPTSVNPKDATWFALAKIAFMGAKAARYHLGDRVLVIGAGPVGQMSVRWANAAGCETITVVDMIERRLEMAQRGGATHVIARPVAEAAEEILAANGGQPPEVVVDTTGNAAVFADALGVAAPRGRVIVLGDTGSPSQQHLTSDVIVKGLHIVGAHDSHGDAPWSDERIYGLFFSLVETGRFDLGGLITHTFRPADAKEAYATADRKRAETMGLLFDWMAA